MKGKLFGKWRRATFKYENFVKMKEKYQDELMGYEKDEVDKDKDNNKDADKDDDKDKDNNEDNGKKENH